MHELLHLLHEKQAESGSCSVLFARSTRSLAELVMVNVKLVYGSAERNQTLSTGGLLVVDSEVAGLSL